MNSTQWLREMALQAAGQAGLSAIFRGGESSVSDDHVPFLDAGIPALDLIDLNYGPNNSYWHTAEDTLDKLSSESLENTGRLVLALLPLIEAKLGRQ
jgi:glutaminyl-peptide cyclotransferase